MAAPTESLTPYERMWQQLPPNHRIEVGGRAWKYDPLTGLLYFPTIYNTVPIQLCNEPLPDDEWITTHFMSFVQGEFGKAAELREGGEPTVLNENIESFDTDLSELARQYLENCESELVYSGYLRGITESAGPDMGLQMYNILTDPLLGNRETKKYVDLDAFKLQIEPAVKSKSRLLLVFPGFPFKDQNIFRTNCPASHVDMADLAFMVRLHILSLALYQVHPYGVDWIVLSDGSAYAKILGVEEEDAKRYVSRLRHYRAQLNLHYTVHILDLRDIAQNLIVGTQGKEGQFSDVIDHLSTQLHALKESDPNLNERFRVLTRGMKWNMNWKAFFEKHGVDTASAWRLLRIDEMENLSHGEIHAWGEMTSAAEETAVRYAAFNLALKFVRFYEVMFPGAIKATSHPKSNEIGVPTLGDVAPWNGVCLARDLSCRPGSFETVPLHRLSQTGVELRCYQDYTSRYPAFYSRSI